MTEQLQAQIVIIGAGVAGCTAALALAPYYDVLLIDHAEQVANKVGECLPPAAGRILEKLQLMDEFEQSNQDDALFLPYLGVRSFWGTEQAQYTDNLRNPDGLGWQLNRQGYEQFLRRAVLERNIRTLWPVKLKASHQASDGWVLELEKEQQGTSGESMTSSVVLGTQYVIDATGRHSAFVGMIGIEREAMDKQVSYWATYPCDTEEQLATIASCDSGWWYSAKLPGQKRVLALQTDADIQPKRLHKTLTKFLTLASAIPAIEELIPEQSDSVQFHGLVSANTTRLSASCGIRWAAIGDVACSFDPLSSQGMFNAMATAMQLADLLIASDLDSSRKLQQVSLAYLQQIDSIWLHYLYHRHTYYRQERRWLSEPYWQRRLS